MNVPIGELKDFLYSMPNIGQNLIVCCDPGTDDIVMQAQVNALARTILAYIPCAGNTSLRHTVNNALLFTEITGRKDVKVFPGSSRPSQATEISTDESGVHVFGAEGLGNLKFPNPLIAAENQNGVEFAIKAIESTKKPVTIVSTAGLTDVCKILNNLDEKLIGNIAAISVMGGVLDLKQANAPLSALQQGIPRWAEFNIIYDPNSASRVFKIAEKYRIPIFLSPLDLTHTLTYKKSEAESLRKRVDNYVSKIMADLMLDVPIPYLKRFGEESPQQPAHDLNASMSLFHPDLYQYQRGFITVDGEDRVSTRGKTTFTHSENGNVFVLSVPGERRPGFFSCYEEDLMKYNTPIHRIRGYLYDIRSEKDIEEGSFLVKEVLEENGCTGELNLSGLLITPVIAAALIKIIKNNPTVMDVRMSLPQSLSEDMEAKIKAIAELCEKNRSK